MSKLKYPLLLLSSVVFISFAIGSCDRIDDPVADPVETVDTTTVGHPLANLSSPQEQTVLIEDYTGHKCSNCPQAAVVAKGLEEKFGPRVYSIAVHSPSGVFQFPSSSHPTDFRTEAGVEYAITIPAFGGNPQGLINRRSSDQFLWLFPDDWSTLTSEYATGTSPIALSQSSVLNESQDSLLIKVYAKSFEQMTGDFRVVSMLIRKSVVAAQTLSDGSVDESYVHHNVLSENFNGTWGSVLSSNTTIEDGDLFTLDLRADLATLQLDDTYALDNLSILSFVCDRETYEIFQSVITAVE